MKWIKFKAAYVNGQWKIPFFLEHDKDGRIIQTSESEPPRVDLVQDAYFIPGVPNGHSHSFQYVMAGLAERVIPGRENDDFWFWREQMYKLANTIRPEELLSVTTQLYQTMLEYGYTSVTEFHYLNHDFEGKPFSKQTRNGEVLMEAAKLSGMKLTLVPVYYHQAAPNVAIKPDQKRFYFDSVDRYLRFIEDTVALAKTQYPSVTVGYGVHSLRAAPLEDIKRVIGGRWTNGPCHLHASEQTADVDSFVAAYGQKPIVWLSEHVDLGERHHLVHATHIDEVERKLLVKSGATVVLCPTTESNLGDGIFPLRDYHREGGSWSIGSDSQVNLNPFIEMASLELTQRLIDEKRNVLCSPGRTLSGDIVFDAALSGGRKSVGLPARSWMPGSLLEGVLIDPEHERLWSRPLESVLSILSYAPEKSFVKAVYAEGQLRVVDGHHLEKAQGVSVYRQTLSRLMGELQAIQRV